MSIHDYVEANTLGPSESLPTTVLSHRAAAEAAGWSRDVDQEDTACFMNDHGTHEYCYAATWAELCDIQGITAAEAKAIAIVPVSHDFAQRLLLSGETLMGLLHINWWHRHTDVEPSKYLADEPGFADLHRSEPTPGLR